ncbi:hypothetical protein A3K24_00640 [candidate division Kazan bacterium RIFCSPHIGHO2_01_FULL_44_14]|uniref:YbbR-like protein n=1 Tax=candidate division Kazan bacterium RIFCSPLOWO2_01_FULL_45_19 TaxID=1798538 RepID=A0A1F4NR52_UNCK3|nr:MAG: hypothetical protein A3K51_00640 [candidate division Kazan bacterium RIFCSPLOWO2_01_FULL_45_19]OGB77617.1 MAG: hypothetical protein A3K24_00640 [candidate division Kazan bacterium RIFCSPHIGHO2_01_FULL_44_14]
MRFSDITSIRVILIITAVLIWVNVYALSYQTKSWSAPIIVKNLPAGLAVANGVTTVTAKISGRPYAITKLNDISFQFQLDLSGIATPGRYSRPIVPLAVPNNIRLINYQPTEVVVDLDVEVSKIVPVVLNTTGWVADGYSVKQAKVVPDRVTIYGAGALLDKITHASAEVTISHRRESFTVPISFQADNGGGQSLGAVRMSPAEGQANIEIGPGAASRNLGLKASFVNKLPGGFWVQEVKFEPAVVLVSGTQQALDQLAYLTTTPINLNGRTKNFTDQVAVDLPNGISLVGENLILTTVTIGSSQGTKQLTVVPQYANVTEGFSVTTTNPGSIQVILAGAPEMLKGLTRNDVILNLDLRGALSGANMIEINQGMFTTPTGVEVVSFAPIKVEVVLSRVR